MNCVKCGSALETGARFCGACGTQQPGAIIPQAAVRTGAKTLFQGGGIPLVSPAPVKPAAQPAPQPAVQPASQPAAPQLVARPEPLAPRPVAQPQIQQLPPAQQQPLQAPRPTIDHDLTGQLLNNRYRVEAKIGEGGFGAVYRATQTQMNRKVALKVLHARMARDPQVVGRFKREAQASSSLRAPHTVQVYDFDQSPEGVMYLAMEMLQGRSLHAILTEDGPLSPARMVRVMDGIADSLGEAHGQGIVHRDIKPENIYLESRPEPDFVKVLDFGIAKIVSGEGLAVGPALTAAGQTLGTLEYMSPEQLMGAPLDGRSDLYALGILSYELLVGELPFGAKTPGEMITAHLKTVPKPPSQAAPARGISPLLDHIILKLLAKKRDERFADTAALRAELARLQRGETTVAGAPSKPAMQSTLLQEPTPAQLATMMAQAQPLPAPPLQAQPYSPPPAQPLQVTPQQRPRPATATERVAYLDPSVPETAEGKRRSRLLLVGGVAAAVALTVVALLVTLLGHR